MSSGTPRPVAEGSLAQTPFGHVLLSVVRKQLSGTLAVWPDEDRPGQDRIKFVDGVPVGARLLDPAPSLDRGLLSLFGRQRAPYAFYESDLVGDGEGVIRGTVDPLHLIASALRGTEPSDAINRVLRRLGDVPQRIKRGAPLQRFSLLPNEMAFIEFMRAEPTSARELVEQFGDPTVARRMLYLLGVSGSLEAYKGRTVSRSKLKVAPSGHAPISLDTPQVPQKRPSPAGQPNRAAMRPGRPSTPPDKLSNPIERLSTPPEANPVHTPSPLPGAVTSSIPPQIKPSSIPPAKSLSGQIVAPRNLPPKAPDNLSPELKKKWSEVERVLSMLDRQTYYEMLGIKESSTVDDVRTHYMQLAKMWHPDRLPAELAPVRPWVEEIFHLYTAARDTLSDPKKRDEYQRTVMQGGGTPESERQIEALVEAALAFQKVDVLVRRRKWDEAMAIVEKNIQIAPKEPDYHSMKAWIIICRDGVEEPVRADQVRELLRKSFALNPNHVHSHYVRAHFNKRLGNHDKALAHFRKVAQLDPKNLEAVREARIGKMRISQGRSSAPPGVGKRNSLFNRLRKKK